MKRLISRSFGFDSAHKLMDIGGSKCLHLHGHRYTAIVTISAHELDTIGRVLDFSEVKQIIGGWIDQNWDHAPLFRHDDPLGNLLLDEFTSGNAKYGTGRKPYIMEKNPTAENIAEELYRNSVLLLKHIPQLTVEKVKIYETPNCSATYIP